jgi:ELWxxDGT repeat protein
MNQWNRVVARTYCAAMASLLFAGRAPAQATPLLFTDTQGLWSLNESSGQVTKLASIVGDVNGVAYQAGSLAVAGGKAYFAGGDPNNPLRLYVSDGTAGGTRVVHTFGGGQPATIADLTALSSGEALLVFYSSNGDQTLWTTSGTGVTEITNASTGKPYVNTSGVFPAINLGPGQSGEIGGELLFTDTQGLWSLNESSGQVTKLASIVGDVNGVAYQAGSLAVAGSKAYFAGSDPNNPLRLYVSDGTTSGTRAVHTFGGGEPATIADLTALSSGEALLVFYSGNGDQTLWTTSGTGVTEIINASTGKPYVNTSGVFPAINLGPGQSGEIGGELLFTDTQGLWSLNESSGQVTKLASIVGDVNGVAYQAGSLAVASGHAYFAGGDPNNPLRLYISDGTTTGTRAVHTFGGGEPATIADLTALSSGQALLVFYSSNGDQTLWTTSGTGVTEIINASTGKPYVNTSGAFPAINLGPGQSVELP